MQAPHFSGEERLTPKSLQGRWLAETEERKRKGSCLLDARVSTRTLFARERATALSSTATVDITIKYPVLYVGVYTNGYSPHEDGEYHWAFLIGPSNESAEDEGVRCGIEFHQDSNGRPTWSYNQTVVPLRMERGPLVRLLIAEIVDLGPLGKIIRDQNSTPTIERANSRVREPSLTWVRETLKRLEKKPECFARKCSDFSLFKSYGKYYAKKVTDWQRKEKRKSTETTSTRLSLVSGWETPDSDETKVLIKFDLTPNLIAEAVQVVTGVLGQDALERRRQIAKLKKPEFEDNKEKQASTTSKRGENAATLAEPTKPQGVGETGNTAKNIEGQRTTSRREISAVPTLDLDMLGEARGVGRPAVKKDGENADQPELVESEEDDDDEASDDEDDEEDEEDEEEDEDDDEDDKDDKDYEDEDGENENEKDEDETESEEEDEEEDSEDDNSNDDNDDKGDDNDKKGDDDDKSKDDTSDDDDKKGDDDDKSKDDTSDDDDKSKDDKSDNDEDYQEESSGEDDEDGEEDSDEDDEDEGDEDPEEAVGGWTRTKDIPPISLSR